MQTSLKITKGIEALVQAVLELSSDPKIKGIVDSRIQEFIKVHEAYSQKWYEELIFCILTAYSSAKMGVKCLDSLSAGGFLIEGSLYDLKSCLMSQGHRFAERRAEYIFNTRKLAPSIKTIIQRFRDSKTAREWLVKNIKGIGWKEASHFLRNVGYLDVAIIDRHIVSNLLQFGLIEESEKSLTKRRYLAYEKILESVAEKLAMEPGRLDLYLWYMKTGKVIK